MGFADISIADIAKQDNLLMAKVFHLCNQLAINYKNQQTFLALEDAKAVIAQIMSRQAASTQENKTIWFRFISTN